MLPVDKHVSPEMSTREIPRLIHSMTVNTLNFCSFAWTRYIAPEFDELSYLVALPHTLSSEAVDVFQVTISLHDLDEPTVNSVRKTTIPAPKLDNPRTGLTMCLYFQDEFQLLVGYESGHTIVYNRESSSDPKGDTKQAKDKSSLSAWQYKPSYTSRPHSQPILSIHGLPSSQFYVTTAADAKLVTHSISKSDSLLGFENVISSEPFHSLNTKHSGQQGLSVRDDGLLLATAGWDTKGRVYRAPQELEDGEQTRFVPPKEIAVLKWHKEGCYCTAFAHVQQENTVNREQSNIQNSVKPLEQALETVGGHDRMLTAAQRREREAKMTHWLALGSKDGKISLWNIP